MSKQHNHLWGSNYVLQHLARAVVAAAGPPCFRQQVQLTIWQLTPMEGVIQSSRGRVDPMQALLGSQSQSQQTSKPLTQEEEGGRTTWRRRWWRRDRWRTDASTLFSLTGVGQTCCLFSSFFLWSCQFSVIGENSSALLFFLLLTVKSLKSHNKGFYLCNKSFLIYARRRTIMKLFVLVSSACHYLDFLVE